MSLDDFAPERVPVVYKGKPLMQVRGLSLDDIAVLVREHLQEFRRLSDLLQATREEIFARVQTEAFILEMVAKSPYLAASMIGQGADEPDKVERIRTLPMGVQLIALQQIVRLTVEDVGGPKAFVALLMGMMG